MEINFSESLRNEIASKIPDISLSVIDKSITLEYNRDLAHKYTPQYVESQTNKIYSLNYFFDLVDLFNEIRYSAISSECCRELMKSSEASKEDKEELGWRYKFYVDSAVYRYYSFWEIVGRFFNEYFDLRFEVDKNDLTKEKGFYFGREVLNKIIIEYNHTLLIKIFEVWGKSGDLFEYRIIKTHKRNTRVGEEIIKMTKKITETGRELTIDVGKEYTGDDLFKLLNNSYKNSKAALEYISEFFDIGHSETRRKEKKEETKPKIILPSKTTIYQFTKIIKCNSILIKTVK